MAEIQAASNNLITQAINNTAKQNTVPPKTAATIADTFEKTLPDTSNKPKINSKTLAKVVDIATSVLVFGGLFFLPDIIFSVKNKKSKGIIDKYKKFKPFIGETLTSQKQETLKNGKLKLTLENIKGRFKYNEIMIIDKQGKMKQRIIIRKEELPNGKYIIRNVRSYKGENLTNNKELAQKADKYLFKEYKRTAPVNKEYKTIVKRQNKEEIVTNYVGASDSKPVFKSTLTPTHKINTAFLYENDKCIGLDKQFVPRNANAEQYSVLNIPTHGIHNKKYDLNKDGQQYDKRYLNKLLQNF